MTGSIHFLFFALPAFTLAQRHFFEESSASEYLLIFRHTFGLLLFFSFLLLFVEPEFFSCAIYPHFLSLLTYNGWARFRGHFAFLLAERSCCGCFCYYEVGKHDGWVGRLVGGLAGEGEGGEVREKTSWEGEEGEVSCLAGRPSAWKGWKRTNSVCWEGEWLVYQ